MTLRGVILALAGEPGTACMRNVSKLAECLCSLAVDPENALSYFSNIICKNFKTELKEKKKPHQQSEQTAVRSCVMT